MRTIKWKYRMVTYIVFFILFLYEAITYNRTYLIMCFLAMTLFLFELGKTSTNLKVKKVSSLIGKIVLGLLFLALILFGLIK